MRSKIRTTVFLILLFRIISFSQQKTKYDFEIKCSDGTQLFMNECYETAAKKYEQVMTQKYNCILFSLTQEIKKNSLTDTSLVKINKQLQETIILSQKNWIKQKELNSRVYKIYYDGGSILPMQNALSKIMDIKERIYRLDNFTQLLEQDEIIQCK